MNKKNIITGAIASFAILGLVSGGFAQSAHAEIGLKTNADVRVNLSGNNNGPRDDRNDNDNNRDMNRGNDDRRGNSDNKDKDSKWDDRMGNRITIGTVTAINGGTITIKNNRDNAVYNVATTNAKIYVGSSVKAISDIKVGDTVLIDGSISGSSITAVRILSTDLDKSIPDNWEWKNFKSGVAGTVTASSGTTLTVSAKNGTTYTVETVNAKLQKENQVNVALADIKVGDTVLIQGSISGSTIAATNIFDVDASVKAIKDTKGDSPKENGMKDNGNHYGFFHRLGLWFGGMFKAKSSLGANVNLNGSTFRLTSFNGTEIPSGQNYLLTFNDGRISAKFCNSMNGAYTLSKNSVEAQLASTLMYCSEPQNLMTMEAAFGKAFGAGAKLSQSGSRLTLKGDAGDTFVFSVFMD